MFDVKTRKILSIFLIMIILCSYFIPSFAGTASGSIGTYIKNDDSTGDDGPLTQVNKVLSNVSLDTSLSNSSTTKSMLSEDIGAIQRSFDANDGVKNTGGDPVGIDAAIGDLWNIIKDIITWVIAFGIITSIIVCLYSFIKLATAPSHPTQRRMCMESIIVSIICIVLLGSIEVLLQIFYGTFASSLSSGLIYIKDWQYPATVFLAQYGDLAAGFSGVVSLTMLLCLGYSFTQLALSNGNPQKRQQAISSIMLTTVATIGTGGITTFVSFLLNLV